MKLADNDILSLSNLNRFRAGLPDLGVNKAVLTARQIYEINPFAKLEVFDKGISPENIENFQDAGGVGARTRTGETLLGDGEPARERRRESTKRFHCCIDAVVYISFTSRRSDAKGARMPVTRRFCKPCAISRQLVDSR